MSTFVESRTNKIEEVVDDWESLIDAPIIPVVCRKLETTVHIPTVWRVYSDDTSSLTTNLELENFQRAPEEEPSQEVIEVRTKKSFAEKIEKVKDLLVSKRSFIDDVQVGLSQGGKISLKHHTIEPFGDIKLFLTKAKIYATGHGKQHNLSQLETAHKKAEAELRTAIANVRRIEQNGVKVPECDLKRVIDLNTKVSEKKTILERAKSEAEARKGMKKNEDIKEILQQFVDLLNRDSSETSLFLQEFQTICGVKSGVKKESATIKTKVVKTVAPVVPVDVPVVPAPNTTLAPAVASPVVVAPKRSVFRGARF